MYTDYTDYTEEDNNDESYYVENNDNQNKEKLKKIGFIVLVFVVLVIVIVLVAKGCSNNENDDSGTSVNENRTPTIAINWQSITLEVGESYQLVADVLLASTDNAIATWHSDDSGIAAVNDDGYVTALQEGETNIIATYLQDGVPYTANCSLVVIAPDEEVVEIQSINIIQENISLREGGSVLLQVDIQPVDAKVEPLVFTSDNTSIATVSDEGRINAINAGTTTITAKTSDGKLSDSVTVRVTESGTTVVNPVSLQLIGLENGVSVGTSSKIAYIISPSNATTSLTWSSSNPSVATVRDGVVTGVSAGTCTIIASTSNNISSSLQITVSSNDVAVTGITINGDTTINMRTGWTKLLQYTISPSNATNKNVTFTSSNSNVVFVDSNGIIAAIGAGNAVVTITTEDGNKRASVNVTVTGESGSTGGSGDNGNGSSETGNGNGNGNENGNSSSSSTSDGKSCTAYDMITISHNGKNDGAVVSTISFSNTEPFTNSSLTPTLTVTDFADCLSYATYYIYYGTTTSNISGIASSTGTIRNSGATIKLDQGNGYYKILVKGYDSANNKYLNKYYYAHVNNNSSSAPNIISFTSVKGISLLNLKINTTKGGANLRSISYCLIKTSTALSCSDFRTIRTFTSTTESFNGTITVSPYVSSYYGACIKVTDINGKTKPQCIKY